MFTNRSISRIFSVLFNVVVILSLLIGAVAFPSSAHAKNIWTMVDLGTLDGSPTQAFAINNAGQVIGNSDTTTGQRHAFIWDNGVINALGTLGGIESYAVAINESGQIVGWSNTLDGERHAFLWSEGVMTDLGTLGGSFSSAADINEAGQIIGSATTAEGQQHAFIWDDGVMIDLGTSGGSESTATAINDTGQIIGWSNTLDGGSHAFLWSEGVMTDLGTLGGSYSFAIDINEAGQIVGRSWLSGDSYYHAFLWEDGMINDLGTLHGEARSIASDINETGQIVGASGGYAFVWEDGTMTDIGKLSGSNYASAIALNDAGRILGFSGDNFQSHVFVWEDGAMTDLGTLGGDSGWASAINETGQIIGSALTAGNEQHAFVAEVTDRIITVTTTLDNTTTDGKCSLREAIINANNNTATYIDCDAGIDHDKIVFADALGTATITVDYDLYVGDTDILTVNGGGDITISGNNLTRIFYITVGASLTLNDLVISNGYSSDNDGGGINNYGSLTLNRTTVSNNIAIGRYGGGIYNYQGTVTLNDSVISDNSASIGGGIYNSGALTLNNSTVINNENSGISNIRGTLTINNSTISENSIDTNGGGISNWSEGNVTIDNSTISNNSANSGGGIFNGGTLLISNSTINNNSASSDGGALWNVQGTSILRNSTVSGNSSEDGGGIANNSGTTTLNFSTVADNTSDSNDDAVGEGGGIYIYNGTVNLKSSIVVGNRNGTNGIFDWSADCYGIMTSQDYNLAGIGTGCGLNNATDIRVRPTSVFTAVLAGLANNGGPTQTHALLAGSPAQDQVPYGINECGTDTFELDQRGETRPFNTNCDMGAYEEQSMPLPPAPTDIRYVAPTGSNLTDCTILAMPCATIAFAVSEAVSGNTIKITTGTYTEAGISIDKDLTLIGAGAESTIVQAANDPGSATNGVFLIENNASVTIDSVSIQHGKSLRGGGIYVESGSLLLKNSDVHNNVADMGGGLSIFSGSTLTLADTTIRGNSATYSGGGIFIWNQGTVTMNNSTVGENSAGNSGGGLYNSGGTLMLNNSTISGNSASAEGGGFFSSGTVTLTTSTVSGNSAGSFGGGINQHSGTLTLNFSTVTNNNGNNNNGVPSFYGGGISVSSNGTAYLKNSIVAGNSVGSDDIDDPGADCSGVMISQGYNLTGNGTGCNLNEVGDVTVTPANVFTKVLGLLAANGGATQTHELIVVSGNPALNAIPGGIIECGAEPFNFDQRGEVRPFNMNCDMGAYEAQSASPTLTVTPFAKSKVYGTPDPDFTFTYTGFVGSDGQGDIDTPPTCTVNGVHVNTGSHTITCSGGVDDKYDFTYVDGILTITKADQTIINAIAPDNVANGDVFTVSAGSTSNLPVSYSASGVCTNIGASFTMTSGTGICTVVYDQAGDTNYNPAPQVTRLVTAMPTLGIRHVATTGDDVENDCFNSALPCATITHAIAQASSGDTIEIKAGVYTEVGITIDKDLTLIGEDPSSTIVQAAPSSSLANNRVFIINSGVVATIENLSIRNGKAIITGYGFNGGGIYNSGSLTLKDSVVSGNLAYGEGGGVYNYLGILTLHNSTVNGNSSSEGGIANYHGTLTLNNSAVSDNSATYGGGIQNSYGMLTLNNSTVSNNSAFYDGGGIMNYGGTLIINQSTISHNSAGSNGGGIWNHIYSITLNYSTITNNISDNNNDGNGNGGGIYNVSGDINLKSSILAGNKKGTGLVGMTNASADCSGLLTDPINGILRSQSYNLTGMGTGCNLSGTGDVTVPPANIFADVLGALTDNGGPTQTHRLILKQSNPAIDAIPGNVNQCSVAPFNFDQRGEVRPFNTNCDIGAYEAQSEPTTMLTVTADVKSKVYGDDTDPAFTITYSGFVNGDDEADLDTPPTCSVTVAYVNVGTYPITCSGGADVLYEFTYVSNDLTITPKPITVSADAINKTYGAADSALTYQVTTGSLESGDSFSGVLTRAIGENVGTYIIVQGTLSAGSNYNLTYIGNNLTITKADQTIINATVPTSAIHGQAFMVSATADPSGLPVAYGASDACTNVGATFTMTSGSGICTVTIDQPGDANYNPAPQVVETVTAVPAPSVRYVSTVGVDTGYCANPISPCATIAYAISRAVAGNTIEIAAGTYTEAGITVNKNLILTGAGASSTIVQAAASPSAATDRVFFINSGVTTTIQGMTIQYGKSTNTGGGIFTAGSTTLTLNNVTVSGNSANVAGGGISHPSGMLTLNDSTVSGNWAGTVGGGGIYNFGTMTITNSNITGNSTINSGGGIWNNHIIELNDSTVSDNSASGAGGGIFTVHRLNLNNSTVNDNTSVANGGGIYNAEGIAILNNSTVSGNSTNASGGGLVNFTNTMSLNNSTVSGNTARQGGAGIYNADSAELTVSHSTVTNNTSDSDNNASGNGGGIFLESGLINLKSSIVAGNQKGASITASTADCFGSMNSQGHNLTSSGTGCSLSGTGDVLVNPAIVFTEVMDVLANNGGPTQTHALTASSSNPALNTIPDSVNDCGIAPFDFDQRGETRPTGTHCDIGAYESEFVNSAPIITEGVSIDVTMSQNGSPVAFASTLHATDPDGNTLTWSISAPAGHGTATASGTGLSKIIGYTPQTNYNGTDSFDVQVSDGNGGTDTITVNVTITPVNVVPVLDAIDPVSARVDDPDLDLDINGTNFASNAIIKWRNITTNTTTDLVTTYVSSTELSTVVPSALLVNTSTFEISVFNPAPGGGTSISLPFFVTQSAASVISSDTATSTDPTGTAVATTGGSGPGTPGSITATGTGTGTVTVTIYDSNPRSTSPFRVSGKYFDVYVAQGSNFSSVQIVACNMTAFSSVRWLDSNNRWKVVNPQSYSNGCITMNLSNTSLPRISQLTGTIFGVEETPVKNIVLIDSQGGGLEGATAQYYVNGWRNIPGSTDADGILSYDSLGLNGTITFRITYANASIQKQQNITNNPEVTFQTQLVSMQLLASDATTELNGDAQYYSNGWLTFGNGTTSTSMELLPLNYTFRVSYGGASVQKQQNIGNDPAVVFQTKPVSMQLLASNGTTELNGSAEYYANGWKTFGGGSTSTTMELLPVNYTFRVSYGGASIQKQQDINTNAAVVFQTKQASMQLLASNGTTELLGIGEYYANGWKTFGNGSTSATMELLPVNYTFRVSYGGASIQKQQDVNANAAVVFQTKLASMQLLASNGTTELSGASEYYANGWKIFGNGSTTTTMELLPVSYTFRVSYGGASVQKQQDINSNPLIVFQTKLVTMQLLASNGTTMLTGSADYYANGWKTFGNGSTTTTMELLPVNYTFRVSYGGASVQKQQDANTNQLVVFQTGQVHSNSASATQYYANGWKAFVQGMELLPGSYAFKFNDGTLQTTYTLTVGIVNNIH